MSIQYLVLLEGFQRAPWDATLGSTQRELDFREHNDAADILGLGVVTRKASQLCSTVKFRLRNWKSSFTDYDHPASRSSRYHNLNWEAVSINLRSSHEHTKEEQGYMLLSVVTYSSTPESGKLSRWTCTHRSVQLAHCASLR